MWSLFQRIAVNDVTNRYYEFRLCAHDVGDGSMLSSLVCWINQLLCLFYLTQEMYCKYFLSGFGANSTTAVGTPIKFTPVTGSDTMVKNGVTQTISTRHHCITCMKEYESKSLEELRLEDYAANRKGPQQVPQQTGLFGTSSGASLFGTGASTSTGTGGIFTDSKPMFGGGTSIGKSTERTA
jgi:hypothetical protein